MIESNAPAIKTQHRPVIVVVEGQFDIEFLQRISRTLHAADSTIPNLVTEEADGNVILVPFGGGGHAEWISRFQSLRLPEFHLFDRETSPETESRLATATAINVRPGCRAVVMRRRSLENYLHPDAVTDVFGVVVEITPQCPVVQRLATALHRSGSFAVPWQELSRKGQHRLFNRLKRRLNTAAADHMTVARLQRADPAGEIHSWLAAISRLATD
ncbi:MAG: ATP-dependent endonuclease [Rhodopirellula sp.]|nr:ATP-dependent endonuclease [Rhodopirellula sp.]